jgi:tetratricopeptide (TPR) repeat protein
MNTNPSHHIKDDANDATQAFDRSLSQNPSLTAASDGASESPSNGSQKGSLLDAILQQADRHYGTGNLQAASEFLELASLAAPDTVALLAALGSVHFRLGNLEVAQKYLARAVELDPMQSSLHTQLAAVFWKLGRITPFQASITRALEINPEDVEAMRLAANYYLEKDRYMECARAAKWVLERVPGDVNALLSLGKCFFKLGDPAMAKDAFQRAAQLDPANAIAIDNMAIMDRQIMPTPPKVSQTMPGSGMRAEECLAKADAAYSKGDLVGARVLLAQALEFCPDSHELYDTLGSIEFQLGDSQRALDAFQKAAAIQPNQSALHTRIAMVHQKMGRHEAFENSLSTALALDPDSADALKLLANEREKQNRHIEAARCCIQLLKKNPADIDTLMLLAKCLYLQGDREMARQTYEQILQHDPANAIAVDNIEFLKTLPAGHRLAAEAPSQWSEESSATAALG